MKTRIIRNIMQLAACSLLLASCTKKSTPEQTALSFFDALYNEHDIEKAEGMVTDESKEKLQNDFKYIEGALQIVKDKTPVHYEYVVVDEKTVIKNDSAFVTVKTPDDNSEMKILLLNKDGIWKVDFNYDENNLNAAQKELTDSVLNIVRQYADSIEVGTK